MPVVNPFVDTDIACLHIVMLVQGVLVLYAPLAAMVDTKHGLGILIMRGTALQVKIVVHKIHAVKEAVHCHKALACFVLKAQHAAIALRGYFAHVRAKARRVKGLKNIGRHNVTAF